MLSITVPEFDYYDEETNQFRSVKSRALQLEHSLISISKWESKWEKPFLEMLTELTNDQFFDYIRCMTITPNVDPLIYYGLTPKNQSDIIGYMNAKMTATTVKMKETFGKRKIVTSELIYYWMVAMGIPFECEKWHINRLLALIQVCSVENAPNKKLNAKEATALHRSINEANRAKLKTRG